MLVISSWKRITHNFQTDIAFLTYLSADLQLDSAIRQVPHLLLTSLTTSWVWLNSFIQLISDADTIANGSYSCMNGNEGNKHHSDVRTHGGAVFPSIWLGFFKDFSLPLPYSQSSIIITITVNKKIMACAQLKACPSMSSFEIIKERPSQLQWLPSLFHNKFPRRDMLWIKILSYGSYALYRRGLLQRNG